MENDNLIIPFGKYKGLCARELLDTAETLEELYYLRWLSNQDFIDYKYNDLFKFLNENIFIIQNRISEIKSYNLNPESPLSWIRGS